MQYETHTKYTQINTNIGLSIYTVKWAQCDKTRYWRKKCGLQASGASWGRWRW